MAIGRKLITEAPQVVEGYKNGLTLRALGEFYGVSAGTIRNILKREGQTIRGRGRRRRDGNTPKDVLQVQSSEASESL
jgi:hypothetical protein